MNLITLDAATEEKFSAWLAQQGWVVACLCARWCDLCESYRATFTALAARHPDKHFVWIDIEDQAALVGEMEVENFPTLLMQRADCVAFFGTLEPHLHVADKILAGEAHKSPAELQHDAQSNAAWRAWQRENVLRAS